MDANSTVAVVYSGHLGVVVPEAGALARRFLIDPLRASVFVAGQHGSSVTGGHNWVGASAHACPGHRLRGRPARGSVETKVAQRSGQLALQWRLLSAPAHASSSGQPRPVSCLGRAGRLQHRSPSQHSSPSKEIT